MVSAVLLLPKQKGNASDKFGLAMLRHSTPTRRTYLSRLHSACPRRAPPPNPPARLREPHSPPDRRRANGPPVDTLQDLAFPARYVRGVHQHRRYSDPAYPESKGCDRARPRRDHSPTGRRQTRHQRGRPGNRIYAACVSRCALRQERHLVGHAQVPCDGGDDLGGATPMRERDHRR